MPKEIERKFLVRDTACLAGLAGTPMVQGYLATSPTTVRVRRAGDAAFLTIKGGRTGLSCDEYEYAIPLTDAEEMLNRHCGTLKVEKTRYLVPVGAHTFEVDVFAGKHRGLVVAEVELQAEDEVVDLPDWLGPEVSHDARYSNADLARASRPPLSDPVVQEGFLFLDTPFEGLVAAVILTGPLHRFDDVIPDVEARIGPRSGKVLIDTLLANGNLAHRFFLATFQAGKRTGQVSPIAEPVAREHARLCAPALQQYQQHLDLTLLLDPTVRESLRVGLAV